VEAVCLFLAGVNTTVGYRHYDGLPKVVQYGSLELVVVIASDPAAMSMIFRKDDSAMKRSFVFLVAALLAFAAPGFSQNKAADSTADPYKATLNRIESLSRQPESEWRYHTDVPHPEDPSLNDSDWGVLHVKNVSGPGGRNDTEEHWTGTRVFRRWIQVPEKINGYATQGSQVRLDLRFGSPGGLMITVFSSGAIVYRGSDDDIQPVLLSTNAQPGQKFLVAARVVAPDDVQSEFFHSELTIEPPNTRPSPGLLRLEILAARPIIAAYEEGRQEREQQLATAVKAIDFSPLERGDQAGFDNGLKQAHSKLEELNPGCGNSAFASSVTLT
jgi:hypothetical protein